MKKNRKTRDIQPEPVLPQPAKFTFSSSFWVRLIIVFQLCVIAWQFYPQPSTNGDNAKYFVVGTAIAHLDGYRQIYMPHAPVETQYPFVFPLFLGLLQLFSNTVFLPKLFMALIAITMTLLLYYLGSRRWYHYLLPVVLVTATSNVMARFSVMLMSEVPYLLCTVAALFVFNKSSESPGNKKLFWAAIALSILPVNCRSAGLAFSAAFVVGTLLNRQWRYALAHVAVFAALTVLFRSLTAWDSPYLVQLFQRDSYNIDKGFLALPEMLGRITKNIDLYSKNFIAQTFLPFTFDRPPKLRNPLSLILTVFIVIGWVRGLFWKESRMTAIYLFFYFGILSMWQTQWSSERFVIPVLPFLALLLFLGVDTLVTGIWALIRSPKNLWPYMSQSSPKPMFKIVSVVVVWALAATLSISNVHTLIKKAKDEKAYTADWRNFYSAADWVRSNTPADAIVLNRKPELFYLRAQRKGLMYPCTHDVEQIMAFMREHKVTHVVFDSFFWSATTARYIYPVISAHSDQFRLVYALRNPDTFVLEYKPQ